VAQIVRPETLLEWHRRLIAQKLDGSQSRVTGKPAAPEPEVEALLLQLARQNRHWGYRRMARALGNLGPHVSPQTVANRLKRPGIAPAPERGKTTRGRAFLQSQREVLAAVDFFTVAGWTAAGLTTY